MNAAEFKKQFECSQSMLNKEYMHSVVEETIDALSTDSNPRGHENLIIVMEELAELSQQVSKTLRGQEDRMHLLEELADVYIGNEFVKSICGFSDNEIAKAINVKLDRLHARSSK